jgi:UrcA family protein
MKHENWWVAFAAASASIVVLAGAATAALAQQHSTTTVVGPPRSSDDVRTARVSYRDLNLAAAHDERILNRRVGNAVRDVCTGNISNFYDLNYPECASGAWQGARPQIAQAVRRAQEIAATGTSAIPMVAIAIIAN